MKFIKFRPLAIKTRIAPIARLSHTEGFPKSGHICGFNENGDFCYAILDTIHYYLRARRSLVEFKPASDNGETW